MSQTEQRVELPEATLKFSFTVRNECVFPDVRSSEKKQKDKFGDTKITKIAIELYCRYIRALTTPIV
jgi:hypothetical protein